MKGIVIAWRKAVNLSLDGFWQVAGSWRIPTEELERLKQEVALERLVESAGVELKAHGADQIGRCPFHDDRTPSLVVSPKKNLWHCLGACQTGGTVIAWVMKTQGVSFRHAVEILQDDLPLGTPSSECPSSVLYCDARPRPVYNENPESALDVDATNDPPPFRGPPGRRINSNSSDGTPAQDRIYGPDGRSRRDRPLDPH